MTIYSALLAKALTLVDSTGVTQAASIGEIALEETMKYVASKVYLSGLVSSATYTYGASDTYVELSADLGISDFETPEHLYVDDVPYVFREWHTWKQLKNSPGARRTDLSSATTNDDRPLRVYTLDPNDRLYIYPISAGNVVDFYYRTSPAAYGDGSGTPEMPALFDSLLVNGAVMYLKEYIREPEQIINPYELFKKLDPQIQELDIHLNSKRSRRQMKLARSYRIP